MMLFLKVTGMWVCLEDQLVSLGSRGLGLYQGANPPCMLYSQGDPACSGLCVGTRYPLMGTQETIPLLSQVLELFQGKTPLVIELKVERGNAAALTDGVMAALEGWNGAYCLESFHPAALLRLKEKYPQVLRGQLSQNFLKPEEANGLSLPVRFALTNLLTTAFTRPDFIAYGWKDRGNASLRLMKALYGVHEVSWTVRDRETMDALDRAGAASIFEGFVP